MSKNSNKRYAIAIVASTICPTVLASDESEYRRQIERIVHFATRIHIDLADGQFASTKTVPIDQVWWPGGVRADLHVMYQHPLEHAQLLIGLGPQLIIVHAEAEGDFGSFADIAHRHGVEVGVALKPQTPAEVLRSSLANIDHVLIFSGNLGHFGGQADLSLLSKVKVLKSIKPQIEIGWDGGINHQNIRELSMGGVDVLNVGGFIQHAADPLHAYDILNRNLL